MLQAAGNDGIAPPADIEDVGSPAQEIVTRLAEAAEEVAHSTDGWLGSNSEVLQDPLTAPQASTCVLTWPFCDTPGNQRLLARSDIK